MHRRRENGKGMSREAKNGENGKEVTRGKRVRLSDRREVRGEEKEEREDQPALRRWQDRAWGLSNGPVALLMALFFNVDIHCFMLYSGCHLSDTPLAVHFALVLFHLVV